jgi:RHS repeat-associated protein
LTRRLFNSIDATQSRTWTYTYTGFGQVLTENGPRTDVSDVTTYTYYNCITAHECGQLQTVTNAAAQTTTYTAYNAHGQPLSITDPNGVVTTLTYDLRQRVTSRTTGGETTAFTYWPNGLLRRVTQPDGTYVEHQYDAAQRLVRIDDGAGHYVAYTLDAMGNRTKEESYDPAGTLERVMHRAFNVRNQLVTESGAANTPAVTTTYGYDAVGNRTSQAAPLSRTTGYTYDSLNRLKTVTDPLAGVTTYNYNRFDELTSVAAPASQTTSYTYNVLGDLTQESSPARGATNYTYDSGGNLATQTDARSKVGTHSYDALNRLMQLSYPDQVLTFGYDAGANGKGRLTSAGDANHTLTWTYDALGRVVDRVQTVGGTSRTVNHGYAAGRLSSMTTPSGQVLGFTYDAAGRVSRVTVNGATLAGSIAYEPYGPVRGWTWGNGTTTTRTYDTDGKITYVGSAGTLNYGYDDAFRITGVTDPLDAGRSWTFGYDANDRLTSGAKTGQSQSWTYNAIGNRLTQGGTTSATYTYSGARLSAVTGGLSRSYTYHAAGSITADGSRTFTYNDAGRMATMTSGGVTTTLTYNALGQRVRKANSSGTTVFVYDEAGRLLGEYASAGGLIAEYVWLDDIPLATLRPNGGGVDVFYIHADHLNTPRKVTRPSDNALRWTWDPDAFGNGAPNPNPSGLGAFTLNLRFPGQYFDAETGLSYNYFRDYDPQIGRYVQSDPIGIEGGLNTYLYVEADPLGRIDPDGKQSLPASVARVCARSPKVCRALLACITTPKGCKESMCKAFKAAKEVCNAGITCRGTDSCETLALKKAGLETCVLARSAITALHCFPDWKKPDKGHDDQVKQDLVRLENCERFIQSSVMCNCLPDGPVM